MSSTIATDPTSKLSRRLAESERSAQSEMIRRIPRHVSIATAAAFVGYLTLPRMSGSEPGSALKGLGLPGAIVLVILWFGFSLMLRRPKSQQWLVLGFVSPFVGGPLLFLYLAFAAGGVRSATDLGNVGTALAIGLGGAVMLSWMVVPIGMGMGCIAALISRAWSKHEAGQAAGPQRLTRTESQAP